MIRRVILDTNIYGWIIDQDEEEDVQKLVEKRPDIVIYGYDVVRKELRNVSTEVRFGKRRVRLALLKFYDRIAKTHVFFTTSYIRQLADDYYRTYKHVGGKRSEKEMMNDFLIVACASMHELDIVVSEDNKTMRSDDAVKAYRIVNGLRKYKMCDFIGYDKFRRLFS